MLASAGSSVKFWDTENSKLIQELPNTSSRISNITWNKDGQFLGALDGKNSEIFIHTVNGTTSVCSGVLRIMDRINCIQFGNTTTRYMAAGGDQQSVLIWDVSGNSKKKSIHISKGGISRLSFNYLDTHFAVGTVTGEAFVISNTTNVVSGRIKLFSDKSKVTDIRYSSMHRSLIGASSESGNVAFVDTNVGKVLKECPDAHTAPISALVFSPLNELLMITVGYDKKFVSYNANSKSKLLSHVTPAPLSSAAFLSNGCIALGTTLGDILTYDIRMLTSPVSVMHAYKGPVYDLRYQPARRTPANHKSKTSKMKSQVDSRTESRKEDLPKSQIITQLPKIKNDCEVKVEENKSFSPSTELLSPVQTHSKSQMKRLSMNSPSLLALNNRTSSSSALSTPCEFDDLGIFSPMDKENFSPSLKKYSGTPKRQSSRFSIVDGILSPLQSNASLNNSVVNASHLSNSFSLSLNDQQNEVPSSPDPTNTEDKDASFNNDTQIPFTSLNCQSDSLLCNGEITSKTGQDIPNIKFKSSEESSLSNQNKANISNTGTLMCLDNSSIECKSNSKNVRFSSDRSTEAMLQANNETSEFSSTRNDQVSTSNTSTSDKNKLQRISVNGPILIEENISETSNGIPQKLSLTSSENLDECLAFEIAFPVGEESGDVNQNAASEVKNDNINSNVNIELLKSYMNGALERHQFEVNQKFMRMHYAMIKQFYNLKKEMREVIKQNSLNEELLQENEILREEIRKLKCTY